MRFTLNEKIKCQAGTLLFFRQFASKLVFYHHDSTWRDFISQRTKVICHSSRYVTGKVDVQINVVNWSSDYEQKVLIFSGAAVVVRYCDPKTAGSSSLSPLPSCEKENWYLRRLMTKPTKWHVCPVKTQVSLGIRGCPGWSESSLGVLATLLVLSWGGPFVHMWSLFGGLVLHYFNKYKTKLINQARVKQHLFFLFFKKRKKYT